MAQDVFAINGNRRGVRTDVDQGTAGTFLCLCQHGVGQGQRCQIHLCNVDTSDFKTLVEVAVKRFSFQDIKEVSLQVGSLNSYRIELVLRVDLVFLNGSIKDFLILIFHVAVGVHELNDHVLCDTCVRRQIFGNNISDTADGLSANANVYLENLCLELVL